MTNLFIFSLLLGIVTASRWRSPHFSTRVLAGFLPAALLILILVTLNTLVFEMNDRWIYHRMAVVIGFAKGYELYYPPDVGPVLNTIYAPMGYLTFLPIALFKSPAAVLLSAGVINYTMMLIPILGFCAWLVKSGSGSVIYAVYAVVLFCFALVQDRALHYSAFRPHVDAPAIGYAGISLAAVMFYDPTRTGRKLWLPLWICAFAAALSVWSKQTFLTIVLIPLIYVWAAWGWRSFLRLMVALEVAGLIVPLILFTVIDPRAFWFNAFKLVSKHPWNQPRNLFGFWLGTTDTVKYIHYLLAGALTAGALLYRREVPEFFRSFRLFLQKRPQIVVLAFGLSLFPFCTLAFIKRGGDVNNYAPMLYFLLAFLFLALPGIALRWRSGVAGELPASGQNMAVFALAFVFIWPMVDPALRMQQFIPNIHQASIEQECAYLEQHKGKVLYPFNPLAHLLVEGKLYHSSFALADRALGGFAITNEHFRKNIPENLEMVIMMNGENWQEAIPTHLPEFNVQAPVPQGFQGWWLCLTKAPAPVPPPVQ